MLLLVPAGSFQARSHASAGIELFHPPSSSWKLLLSTSSDSEETNPGLCYNHHVGSHASTRGDTSRNDLLLGLRNSRAHAKLSDHMVLVVEHSQVVSRVLSKGNVVLQPLNQGTNVADRVHVALGHVPKHGEEATLQGRLSRDISSITLPIRSVFHQFRITHSYYSNNILFSCHL